MSIRVVERGQGDALHIHIAQVLVQESLQRLGEERHGGGMKVRTHGGGLQCGVENILK